MQRIHSFPSWALGPRAAHPKFGGNVIIGGIASVDERLRLIRENFPDDYTSGHLWHEFATDLGAYMPYNSKDSVSWTDLVRGIKDRVYPYIAAITVPSFGIAGVQNGALLSPDSTIRQMYFDMHVDGILKTRQLLEEHLGLGIYIWWPAFDSRRMYHGKQGPEILTSAAAWLRLVDTWVSICKYVLLKLGGMGVNVPTNKPLVWLEWKPEVPGQDYINSIGRAIRFCQEVNQAVGRRVFAINNEWAHLLIGGTTVEEGTRLTIEADLFTGFLHANSADLAIVEINDETGVVVKGSPGDDRDWYVGAGGKARWQDQQKAVTLLCSDDPHLTVIAEHDIDPAGDDPLEYYAISRSNLEAMFEASVS